MTASIRLSAIRAGSCGFARQTVCRFDGYRFKNYTQDDGLPHRNVNDLLETQEGTYLVATSGGLSVFNPNGRAYRWNAVAARLEQTADEPPLFQTFVPPILS